MFLPDYMPTNLDILNCRLKTTGITETMLTLGQLQYRYFSHAIFDLRKDLRCWRTTLGATKVDSLL